MSQTVYSRDMGEAFAGMKVDSQYDVVESHLAENGPGDIGFGYGVIAGTDPKRQVRIPSYNKSTLSIDADLITANDTVATINGTAMTSVPFDTDHATTMANLAAEILTHADVLSATYAGSGRDIVIIGDNGKGIDASAVTTNGASQGTWTQVQALNGALRGVALHKHKEQSTAGAQDADYTDQEDVSVLRRGKVWVPVTEAVAVDDDAYLNVPSDPGKFSKTSTNNVKFGVFRSATSGAGIAVLEYLLPVVP